MPVTLHQGSLKYKNQQGNFTDIDCIKGDTGPGLPSGGTVGQVPIKASATDYDVTWSDDLSELKSAFDVMDEFIKSGQ